MLSLYIYPWLLFFLHLNLSSADSNQNYSEPSLQTSSQLEMKQKRRLPVFIRKKRDVNSGQPNLFEYEVDIDVTLKNDNRINEVKGFLMTLKNFQLSQFDGSMNITSVDVTMVCKGVSEKMSCACESGYAWPPAVCNNYLPCRVPSPKPVCNCIEDMPVDISEMSCAKPKTTLYGTCKVNEIFTNDYLNSSSVLFKKIVKDFESALFKVYQKIKGFLFIRISHVRKGSVIIGYEISGDNITVADVRDANQDVVDSLKSKYDIDDDSFYVTDTGVVCKDWSGGYGFGANNEIAQKLCDDGLEGTIAAICDDGEWIVFEETCVYPDLLEFQEAINDSFIQEHLTLVMQQFSNLVVNRSIPTTAGNLGTIVHILRNISTLSAASNVTRSALQDFIKTVNYILHTDTMQNWTVLLDTEVEASSRLLQSVEMFAKQLMSQHLPLNITKDFIHLQALNTTRSSSQTDFNIGFSNTFFNVSAAVYLPKEQIQKLPEGSTLVSISYPTLGNILPKNSNSSHVVNGLVISVVVKDNTLINDISLTFEKINRSLEEANCAFWDFNNTLWNNQGCVPENETDHSVTCRCSHLTSFSMLMSTSTPNSVILSYIANVGVAVSIGSLFLCLLVEALVWRHVTKQKTSFMRHVCIVNIALSLLLADIWFIIAAINTQWAQQKGWTGSRKGACISATFFIHFFYLSLFFWMLTLGLFIAYRTVLIFHELGKQRLMCIAFAIGYGCPLMISVITLISTAPAHSYTRADACWLNWDDSKALLAFVVPALLAVTLNFMILLLVIVRVQRPTIGEAAPEEKNAFLQTGKRIAILSPILGLTWGIGFAIVAVNTPILALHIIFSILNSLQGLFILIFVVLWDRKVQDSLAKTFSLKIWRPHSSKSVSNISSGQQVPRKIKIFHQRDSYGTAGAEYSSSK